MTFGSVRMAAPVVVGAGSIGGILTARANAWQQQNELLRAKLKRSENLVAELRTQALRKDSSINQAISLLQEAKLNTVDN